MAERREHPGSTADGSVGRVRGSGVRAGIAAAALILAVSGCTGTPAPVPSTHGTPGTVITASPTPSATAATVPPPERPAAMDRADADGAMAAATYFISLYSYAYATGDLAAWTAMSDPACKYCAGVIQSVGQMLAEGSRIEGGEVRVTGTTAYSVVAATGVYPVDLELFESASRELAADGSVTAALDGGKTLAQMDVARGATGWVVRAVKTTDEPSP